MIRFIFRVIACFLLAGATVLAVGDIARSLGASRLRLMSLAQAWETVAPSLPFARPQPSRATDILDHVWAIIATWPAAPSLALLAFVLFLLFARRG